MDARTLRDVDAGFVNFARHVLSSASAVGETDDSCVWYSLPIAFPAYSAICQTKISSGDIDPQIKHRISQMDERGMPWCWFVTPLSEPADLGRRLEDLGMKSVVQLTGMAANFNEIAPEPKPNGIEVRRVESEDEARTYAEIYPKLFGAEDESFIPSVVSFELDIHRSGSPTIRYLGFKDGRAITAGSATSSNGIATLDTLCTLPEERNLGAGAAVALRALWAEHEKGADRATIWAGPGAEKLYARLGFKQVFPIDIYMKAD